MNRVMVGGISSLSLLQGRLLLAEGSDREARAIQSLVAGKPHRAQRAFPWSENGPDERVKMLTPARFPAPSH